MQIQGDRFSLKSRLGIVGWVTIIAIFSILASGCAGNPAKESREAVRAAYEMQKPIQVRTSLDDKRPAWIHRSVFEDDGKVYFSGGYTNGSDYAVTIRCANAEALKSAVQSIGQFIRAEFSSYVHGPNVGSDGVDRYVEDGIATFTQALHVQGMRQKDIYYEEMFSPYVMQSTWNVWVQIEISKPEYMKAKADAIRALRDRFSREGQKEAKEKAERMLDDLRKEVERGV